MDSNKFLEFWYDLFLKPKDFLTNYLSENTRRPLLFAIGFLIYSLGFGISRADRYSDGNFTFVMGWLTYWFVAIIIGVLIGVIAYFLGGLLYNLLVILSKGKSDYKKSRQIFLYSGIIPSALIVLFKFASMLTGIMPNSYFINYSELIVLILLIHHYYMIYIRYIGAITIMGTEKNRSIFWFIVVPVILYTLLHIIVAFPSITELII